jgi:hypothetical protein
MAPEDKFPESTKNKIPIIEYVNLFTMAPIRQFRFVLAISKTTVRAPEGRNHRALLACLIYLGYVHGECQSDPCKIKEIWVKL